MTLKPDDWNARDDDDAWKEHLMDAEQILEGYRVEIVDGAREGATGRIDYISTVNFVNYYQVVLDNRDYGRVTVVALREQLRRIPEEARHD